MTATREPSLPDSAGADGAVGLRGRGRARAAQLGAWLAASDAAAIAAPALLALVVSLIGITGRSLGFDEGATWAIVTQHAPGHGLGAGIAHDGGNMLGFYALEHILIGAFGDSALMMRLPSVVAGALTAALVAAIGLRLFERRVAVLGAALTALTLSVVYWDQAARGYALMLTFTCAGMLAFVSIVQSPARGRLRGWAAAAAYAAAMVAAAYCSFVAVLVVPAQLAALALLEPGGGDRRERVAAWRRFGAALVAFAVCSLPLAVLAARRGSGQLFWVPRPDGQAEKQVLESLTGSGLESVFHPTALAKPGFILTAAAVLVVAALVLRARLRAHRRHNDGASPGITPGRSPKFGHGTGGEPFAGWGAALVVLWAIVPPALVFVYSLLSQPLFQPRNLLTSVPAVALAVALGICDRRLPRWAAAAALAAALAIRVVPLALSYGVSPEPWDAATHAVLAGARPGDCIAFYPEDGHDPFQYYVDTAGAAGPAAAAGPVGTAAAAGGAGGAGVAAAAGLAGAVVPRSVLPATPWPVTRSFVERYETLSRAQQTRLAGSCTRLWLVSSHEGQGNGPPRSQANLRTFDHFRTQLEHVFGDGPVKTYGYASAIHVRLLPGKH